MTRRSVFVALSLVIAALALAIWWAAGHTSANDAPAVRPDAALQPARDPARSELELAAGEPRDARTMATETTTAGVAANETPNESDRPVGRIRVHIVDAEQREDQIRMTAQKIQALDQALERRISEIRIYLDSPAPARKIKEFLDIEGRGAAAISLYVALPDGRTARLKLPGQWSLSPQARNKIRAEAGVLRILEG